MSEINLTESFKFKDNEEMIQLAMIHPILLLIFADFNLYCYSKGLPVIVTRAVAHNIEGVSVSNTHPEGRAIDLSVKGWSKTDIYAAVDYFNNKYADHAAISASDGVPRLLVYHDVGLGAHFHMQIKPSYRR